MSLFYPLQTFGRFGLSYGLTSNLLHARYGLDHGERFHRDIAWRTAQLMEIDRQVRADFGEIGLAPWTLERLESLEQVRLVLEQAKWARGHCDRVEAERRLGFTPHAQPLTSLQNLGSVINTAVSVYGEEALLLGMDDPGLLASFYRNVTDLMLLCLEYFPAVDGRTLENVFVGDCTVAMISPAQYAAMNLESDTRLAAFAQGIGAHFLVHQDSGVSPHLENYARLGRVQGIDFGQDTDWEKAARLFPEAEANCIIFPGWILAHTAQEIEDELERLMRLGAVFPRFSFSILELDVALAGGKVFEFHDAFRRAAEKVSGLP